MNSEYVLDDKITEAVKKGFDVTIKRNKDGSFRVQASKPRALSKTDIGE